MEEHIKDPKIFDTRIQYLTDDVLNYFNNYNFIDGCKSLRDKCIKHGIHPNINVGANILIIAFCLPFFCIGFASLCYYMTDPVQYLFNPVMWLYPIIFMGVPSIIVYHTVISPEKVIDQDRFCNRNRNYIGIVTDTYDEEYDTDNGEKLTVRNIHHVVVYFKSKKSWHSIEFVGKGREFAKGDLIQFCYDKNELTFYISYCYATANYDSFEQIVEGTEHLLA